MQQMQQVLWIDLSGRFKILTHRIIKKTRSLMVLEVLRGCGFPIRESERRHILIKSSPSRPGRTATPEPMRTLMLPRNGWTVIVAAAPSVRQNC